ncbi:MAG: hypothetical protein MUQ43_00025 [Reinekea forsetii]|nr:hypothetical protein [Reinekea forsetii]MDO7672787.1 hypothetical protein [Reinekea forsetii]
MSTVVYVFADWEAFDEPILVGTLRSSVIKNKEHFSFSYDNDWLQSPYAQKIDPDLNLYSGAQLWRRIVFNIAGECIQCLTQQHEISRVNKRRIPVPSAPLELIWVDQLAVEKDQLWREGKTSKEITQNPYCSAKVAT